MFDCILDALIDSIKLLPFLFITYLVMELLEKWQGDELVRLLKKTNKSGPIIGAIAGIVPQCGFSAAAANLFAGGIINAGTLFAVFLSTSDEMIPVVLSNKDGVETLGRILIVKFMLAVISGYILGFIFDKLSHHMNNHITIHEICEHEHCDCHDGPLKSAIKHTVKVTVYIFIISGIINCLIELTGNEVIAGFCAANSIIGCIICAVIGIVPNCAASVVLTEMYLEGIISGGAMMAGLLPGAGVGILILLKLYENKKELLIFILMLLFSGVVWGSLIDLAGITFR